MGEKIPINYREEVIKQFKEVEGKRKPSVKALSYLMDIQQKYVYKGLNHMNCLSCVLKTIKNFKTIISEWEK